MYAFQIERVTHLTLTRENASLCDRTVRHGIEFSSRSGAICRHCRERENEPWVAEWHKKYGVLGPIQPLPLRQEDYLHRERLIA